MDWVELAPASQVLPAPPVFWMVLPVTVTFTALVQDTGTQVGGGAGVGVAVAVGDRESVVEGKSVEACALGRYGGWGVVAPRGAGASPPREGRVGVGGPRGSGWLPAPPVFWMVLPVTVTFTALVQDTGTQVGGGAGVGVAVTV